MNKEQKKPQEEWEPTEAQKKYWQSMRGLKNEKAPNWRGDNTSKSNIHKWLDANYGKPKICENKKCKGKSEWFDWALKTGLKYEKKKDNFLRLCRSCHRRYDLTEIKKQLAVNNLWWKHDDKPPGKLIQVGMILNPYGYNQHNKK